MNFNNTDIKEIMANIRKNIANLLIFNQLCFHQTHVKYIF